MSTDDDLTIVRIEDGVITFDLIGEQYGPPPPPRCDHPIPPDALVFWWHEEDSK